jgi:hypothetical protein
MKQNLFLIILLSLVSTIIFGFIEASAFLLAETTVQNMFIKAGLNMISAEILTSAVSTAISIFIAVWIEKQISKRYKIISHPIISSIGILIGASFFVLLYNIIMKISSLHKIK